jgi:tetratricopeptide (TPR) repeat protein
LDRQPPATISFLCAALRHQAEADVVRADKSQGDLGHRGFQLEIEILRRAQISYPADHWINHRLGVSLIWLRSQPLLVQEGIGYLRAAVALRPQSDQAVWNLGLGYEFLGDHDRAIACFRKAAEFAPQDHALLSAVAWRLAKPLDDKFGDPEEAITLARRAIELSPTEGSYWGILGAAQFRAGHWRAALETMKKSEELGPGGTRHLTGFLSAMAHWHLGEQDEARRRYDQAVAWMDKDQPNHEELMHVRRMAEQLLKVAHAKPTTEPLPE